MSLAWNYEELRRLCSAKGLPDSTVYQNSLEWKRWRVEYHAERAQAVWDELFSAGTPVVVGGTDWEETQFASTAETEAAAQVLHSMADVLAQIINQAILGGKLAEQEVTLAGVLKELRRQKIATALVSKVEGLQKSAEFDYVNAFVNTLKHRRLLDTEYRAEFGKNMRNAEGVRFKAFSYKGKQYPVTWARDILGPYKTKIIELISCVGNAINDHLREV